MNLSFRNVDAFCAAVDAEAESAVIDLSSLEFIENPEYSYLRNQPHAEAIFMAFEPMVSRRSGAGTGLTNVKDRVLQLGGRLRVASNDGFYYIENGEETIGQQAYELPGVQIELWFPERSR